jgi:hypothetical protein
MLEVPDLVEAQAAGERQARVGLQLSCTNAEKSVRRVATPAPGIGPIPRGAAGREVVGADHLGIEGDSWPRPSPPSSRWPPISRSQVPSTP